MSTYLDIARFGEYLARHRGAEADRQKRLVGVDRGYESWYFDIARFFGNEAANPSKIRIVYDSAQRQSPDKLIGQFNAKIAAALRAEGRLYDGPPVVQITGAEWSPGAESISIRALDYAEQVAGFAMDFPDEIFKRWGGTLRNYVREMYPSYDLANAPLKSGVGVCGMVVTKENAPTQVLSVKRSARLASLENSVGPSVAGSVEFADNFRTLGELIERSMNREVQEELGLKQEEYSVRPLAYAREMLRGDRPQLFTVVETNLTCTEIAGRMETLPSEAREFSEFDFVELTHGKPAATGVASFNFEAKMNYYLLEEWLASRQ